MITSTLINSFMNVNMDTVDRSKLTDISTLEFDNTLLKEKRPAYVLEKLKIPCAFVVER